MVSQLTVSSDIFMKKIFVIQRLFSTELGYPRYIVLNIDEECIGICNVFLFNLWNQKGFHWEHLYPKILRYPQISFCSHCDIFLPTKQNCFNIRQPGYQELISYKIRQSRYQITASRVSSSSLACFMVEVFVIHRLFPRGLGYPWDILLNVVEYSTDICNIFPG